ncbi:DUF1758 domain-containing protein [Trichonephila clavata]|uniref:DUF1758 domain-containing protein n=1 Tax=Trichonephila clavata TaxID=2740835 RepID=A0A8X6HUL9_TRICU|nr:DUF1758 domain-containing protein [Trichonephila clavata]
METKGFRLTFNCSETSENCEISLLIGSDFYWSLTHRIKRLDSSLVAVETSLGWSLQGKCDERVIVLRPSPYLLAATLKHHFRKYKEQYPHTFDLLNSSIYVDDFICGRNDVPEALRTTLECLQIFSDASMLLRKWRTNSNQLDLLWQQEGVETEFSETSATDLRPPIKVLGLAWDSEKDLIYFDPKDLLKFMSRKTESKRFILSVVGRIFDPIGILGPFVIKLKCLLQDLWTLGVDWDSELPPKLRHKWQQWSSEAEGLTEIKIPRFYLGDVDQELSSIDIHCFSDASKSAYEQYYTCDLLLAITKSKRVSFAQKVVWHL